MCERGIVFVPTLAVYEATARYAGWKPGEPEPERIVRARAMFARALESGVTIACGGDAGVFAHGENAREIELMVEYGMSSVQALRAATVVAAKVLGREDLGRIAPGAAADLVVLERDPLQDIHALRRPRMVLRAGVALTSTTTSAIPR